MKRLALTLALVLGLAPAACAQGQQAAPALITERIIALPDVQGRIDHLAIDPSQRWLAVAELENHSVDILAVADGKLIHRINGVSEPLGVAFDRSGDLLIVASRADGAVCLFRTSDFEPVTTIALGTDADNVHIDPRNGHAIVGYGDGVLAVIDLPSRHVLARIALPAHPEGFQIGPRSGRVFVNLPDRRAVGVVDIDSQAPLTTWGLPLLLWNYPLALNAAGQRVAIAFRWPARLALLDGETGAVISSQPTCGDADDLFFDERRQRLYVACGEGAVDAFDVSASPPRELGRTRTPKGARTALWAPELDRLFVAARADRRRPAAILVMRPT